MLDVPSMEGLGRCSMWLMSDPCFDCSQHTALSLRGGPRAPHEAKQTPPASLTDCPAQHGGAKCQQQTNVATCPQRTKVAVSRGNRGFGPRRGWKAQRGTTRRVDHLTRHETDRSL